MPTITVTIRDKEYEVEYAYGGYEPDVNAASLDWWFIDTELNTAFAASLTEKENDDIEEYIIENHETSQEDSSYYDDQLFTKIFALVT